MVHVLRSGIRGAGFLAAAGLLSAAACGYRLAGESVFLPNDVRTIYVEPFINRSRDVGIDREIASALKSEFYRRGQLRLVDHAEQADAIVSGVVHSFTSVVASVNGNDEVLQYESTLVLDVTLLRREPSLVLWRGPGLRLSELYAGSRAAVVTTSADFKRGTLNSSDIRRMTDIQLTDAQYREYRARLMERFARELHQRMMEMF